MTQRVITRDGQEWEQVAFAEVLVPNVPNAYQDIYSKEAIRDFAYTYAEKGYGLDINHDKVDVTGTGYFVCESFIARAGDPDFIEGSWVVGIKVVDPALWLQILSGELNGFSFEAIVNMVPVSIAVPDSSLVSGLTEPHPVDGHSHAYVLTLNAEGAPLAGYTEIANGHTHRIVSYPTTEVADGHNHRYQLLGED